MLGKPPLTLALALSPRVYYTDAMGNPVSPAPGKQVLIHFPIHASPTGKYGKGQYLFHIGS